MRFFPRRILAILLGRGSGHLKQFPEAWVTVTFLSLVGVVEFYLLFLCALFPEDFSSAVLMHLLVVMVVWIWAIATLLLGYASSFAFLYAGAVSVLGAFGALGMGVMHLFFRYLPQVELEGWLDSMQANTEDEPREKLLDNLVRYRRVLDAGGTLMSFNEILLVGGVRQKQEVLGAIAHFFHPAFAPLLKRALNDSSTLVRTQAATTLTKIQNQFLQRSMHLERGSRRASKNALIWLEMAEFYDSYAFSGILDSFRAQELRVKALNYYEQFVVKNPNHSRAMRAIGRIYFRNKEYEKARAWFERSLEREGPSFEMVLWLIECHFLMHQFSTVHTLIKQHDELLNARKADMPLELSQAIRLWRGEKAMEEDVVKV